MTQAISTSAVIIILLLRYSYQVVILVDTCPSTKQSWAKKSGTFLCKYPKVYHCIQNTERKLVETCMEAYPVHFSKDGCPWVHVTDGKAYLGNPFYPCNPMYGRCPEKSHRKYRTNQLYAYPACMRPGDHININGHGGLKCMASTTNKIDSVTDRPKSTEKQHFKSVYNSIIGVLVFIIGILVVFICITKNRSNRRSQGHVVLYVQKQDGNTPKVQN